MKLFSLIYLFFFLVINTFAQFTNVMISDENTPSEPSIIIDVNNTNTLFAATNFNNYYVSNDGGVSWSSNTLTSPSYGVWGDPALMIDNNSNFYYFHLSNPSSGSWIDRIVCQKSTDNGDSFSDGSFAGLNGTKAQDKEWPIIDRTNANIYLTWTEFDHYGSSDPAKKSRILFSKSLDSGDSWSDPVKINKIDGDCVDGDETVEGAVPAVGPNGEIYTAWSGPAGIRFNKSDDQGVTWLTDPILVDLQPTGWDYGIPDIDRANGMPITVCDLSEGVNNGTIYVNWSDQRNGDNDTDIWLKKSTDGGNTWSDLIRVNDDAAGKHQFLTWMAIDQTTGYIYIVFYDRRNHEDSLTDVYLAFSTDGAATFTNVKISESAFLPQSNIFFGDYSNITAHNGVIRPIWTRLHSGQISVWTALISHDALLKNEDYIDLSVDFDVYPNPSSKEAYVSFKLIQKAQVSLNIYDARGNNVAVVLDNQNFTYGKHIISIPIEKYNLSSGLYFYSLITNHHVISKKMIIE
jgi:hypothetical protein